MITIEEQLAEVQREILNRRNRYGLLIEDGEMTQADANHKIEVMKAVRDTLPAASIRSKPIREEI
jgi:hypothetical protein